MAEGSYLPEVKILLTGFGPFLDIKTNPSWTIVSRLPSSLTHRGLTVRLLTHPTPLKAEYHHLLSTAPQLITTHSPDAIIHMGLAADRDYFAIERSANRDGYATYPDMARKVVSKAETKERWGASPERLETGFDVEAVVRAWKGNLPREVSRKGEPGTEVRTSDDVGSYVCGLLYFASLEECRRGGREGRVLLFHVPPLPTEEDVILGERVTVALIKAVAENCES